MGCGPACLAQFVEDGKKWYLDPLLDEYRKIFGKKIPQGEYLCSKIEDATLPNDFFDIIVMINSLDHLNDPWMALKKVFCALKPEGSFLLSVYTRHSVFAFLRNLQERFYVTTDSAHPYTFTKKGMERELIRHRFIIESVETLDQDFKRTEHIWTCRK